MINVDLYFPKVIHRRFDFGDYRPDELVRLITEGYRILGYYHYNTNSIFVDKRNTEVCFKYLVLFHEYLHWLVHFLTSNRDSKLHDIIDRYIKRR